MSDEEQQPHYPRDKEALLRDLTLVGRLKDIRDQAMLRERLAPRWWEALLGVVQFAAALGLLASLVQHPVIKADPYGRLAVFWGVLMILSLVMSFEFVIFRMQALRRANEILTRQVADLTGRIAELEKDHPAEENDTQPDPCRRDAE
ncbi:hypothetical protein LLG95_11335 [bacterium]|nr:hypothetical protein [bacterium]